MTEPNPPFIVQKEDIYESSARVKWSFFALGIVYVALLYGQWVTIQNLRKPVHTLYINPALPGELYSERNTSLMSFALKFISLRIFVIMFLMLLLIPTFRVSFSWSFWWSLFIGITVLFQVVAFCFTCVEYAGAHTQATAETIGRTRYNLAADDWFCCAAEMRANPFNMCLNVACELPVWAGFAAKDLRVNPPFFWFFSVNFFLLLVDVGIVVTLVVMWLLANDKLPASWIGGEDKGESEATAPDDPPPYNPGYGPPPQQESPPPYSLVDPAAEPPEKGKIYPILPPSAPPGNPNTQKVLHRVIGSEVKLKTHGIKPVSAPKTVVGSKKKI